MLINDPRFNTLEFAAELNYFYTDRTPFVSEQECLGKSEINFLKPGMVNFRTTCFTISHDVRNRIIGYFSKLRKNSV